MDLRCALFLTESLSVFLSLFHAATVNEYSYNMNLNSPFATFYKFDKGHIMDSAYHATGILQMNNNESVIKESQSLMNGEDDKSFLRLSASFANNLISPDNCVVYFDAKATNNEFDGQLDALKLMNTDLSVPNVYIVTPTGTNISIKALPNTIDTVYIVPLGLTIYKDGEIIFAINDIEGTFFDMKISFADEMTGTVVDLLNNQEYEISLCAGEYLNRFFLNMSNSITDVPYKITDPDLFNISYSKGVLKANFNNLQSGEGSLQICNLLGQTLLIRKIHEEGYHEINIHLKGGVYIATFVSGATRSSKKIVIPD
jgi:hypothetical protein